MERYLTLRDPDRIRTGDFLLDRQTLLPLSYRAKMKVFSQRRMGSIPHICYLFPLRPSNRSALQCARIRGGSLFTGYLSAVVYPPVSGAS